MRVLETLRGVHGEMELITDPLNRKLEKTIASNFVKGKYLPSAHNNL